MHSKQFGALAVGLLSSLAAPVDAYWRMGCPGTLVTERLDPIVDPGKPSGHTHIVLGGNAFGPTMDYASTQKATCTSCAINKDFSNYWVPTLYYRGADGNFTSVSVNGGTVYYQQRVTAGSTYQGVNGDKKRRAFPPGLRMTAGNPTRRTFDPSVLAQKAISHVCLSGNYPEGPALPPVNCPDGVRSQVYFPSCWDGVNLDSANHQDHMSYPLGEHYDSGVCPDSHPVPMISIFYEFIFGTGDFADKWHGSEQPFVYSMGDTTGYGFHGDFFNGWDEATLQNGVDKFTTEDFGNVNNMEFMGIFSAPAIMGEQCKLPPMVDEQVTGNLAILPGCNAVGGGKIPGCTAPTTIGQVTSDIFADMTKIGWQYLGCGTDTYGNQALEVLIKDDPSMTVDMCMGLCGGKGYTYAGLEFGSQCFCGNTLPSRATPTPGVIGACTERCKGNGAQICGNANALSLYSKCGSTCNNAQFGPVSAVVASNPNPVMAPNSAPVVAQSSTAASSVASAVSISVSSAPSVTKNAVVQTTISMAATTSAAAVVSAPSAPGSSVTLPSGWSSAGCVSDSVSPRSLSGINYAWWGEKMTSSGCAKYCAAKGFSIAGTENGGQCFCGNTLEKSETKASTDCNTPCDGNAKEMCGGPGRLSLFKSGKAASRIRRRAHVQRHAQNAGASF